MSRRKRYRCPDRRPRLQLRQQLRHRLGLHRQLHREAHRVVADQVVTEEDEVEVEVAGLAERHEEVHAVAAVVVPAVDRERNKVGEAGGVENLAGQLELQLELERQTAVRARLRHQLQLQLWPKPRKTRRRTEWNSSTEIKRGGR